MTKSTFVNELAIPDPAPSLAAPSVVTSTSGHTDATGTLLTPTFRFLPKTRRKRFVDRLRSRRLTARNSVHPRSSGRAEATPITTASSSNELDEQIASNMHRCDGSTTG